MRSIPPWLTPVFAHSEIDFALSGMLLSAGSAGTLYSASDPPLREIDPPPSDFEPPPSDFEPPLREIDPPLRPFETPLRPFEAPLSAIDPPLRDFERPAGVDRRRPIREKRRSDGAAQPAHSSPPPRRRATRVVSTPQDRLGARPHARTIALGALALTLVIAASFLLLSRRLHGLFGARPSGPAETPTLAATDNPSTTAPAAPLSTWPTPFSVPVKELPPPESLPPGTKRILVLGDSVASFLGLAMRYRQDEFHAFVAERGVGQCTIFEAKTRIEDGNRVEGTSCSASWVEDTARLRPDVTLLVQGGAFFGEQTCDAPWLDAYEARILSLVRAMGPAAGRVFLAAVPYPMDRWRWGNLLDRVDCFNAMLRRTAEKGHVATLDLMGALCPTRACIDESHGKPIRPDGLHFDGAGTEDTARWVLRELLRPAAPETRPGGP